MIRATVNVDFYSALSLLPLIRCRFPYFGTDLRFTSPQPDTS